VDWVVTVPDTVAPLCIMVKLTTVVPVPVPAAPVFGFESTPVPTKAGGGWLVFLEFGSDMPVPPPQEAPAAARTLANAKVRTGFMIASSPSR
jgi:hypothetical protein